MSSQINKEFDEYAVVDLGSNSFYLLICRYINGSLQVIYKNKQNVHLATGLNAKNELSETSIKRGIDCLALFAERLIGFPKTHVRVVATHTLRVAKNKQRFLAEAAKILPYPIEIISGQEEARLIYLGSFSADSTPSDGKKLIIDIGGGSTEIAIGIGSTPLIVESRPMGCVTYTKQFFPQQKITQTAFNKAKLAAEQQVEKLINVVKKQNIKISLGSSGTIKSIHNILVDIGVSDGIITQKRLDDLVCYILECKHFDEIDYPSVSEERKNVFIAGLAIFYGVFNVLNLEQLQYSSSALREGVLYELLDNYNYSNIRFNTVTALSKQYNIDEQHAQQVTKSVHYFFNQWKTQSKQDIDMQLQAILHWAALLHEIGLSINFSSIQKHSGYILQNCNMPGFNEEQQLLLSTLVRYHRKEIKVKKLPYFSLFEYKQVYPLLLMLRLAVLINNQKSADLDLNAFTLKVSGKKSTEIEIVIDKEFAENNRLILLDLEEEQEYWQQLKDWRLFISVN